MLLALLPLIVPSSQRLGGLHARTFPKVTSVLATTLTQMAAVCDAWRGLPPTHSSGALPPAAPALAPLDASAPAPALAPSATSAPTPGSAATGPAPFWLLHSASGTWEDARALPVAAWPLLASQDTHITQAQPAQALQATQHAQPSPHAQVGPGSHLSMPTPSAAASAEAWDSMGAPEAGSISADNGSGGGGIAGSGMSRSSGGQVMLAFSDPCNLPGYPGWPLRNALLMLAARWGALRVRVRDLLRRA